MSPTGRIEDSPPVDILFVCGGIDVPHAVDERLIQLLRRLARERLTLGALCTGAYALARAGLLDGYRCAIHWENLWGLRETFPGSSSLPTYSWSTATAAPAPAGSRLST